MSNAPEQLALDGFTDPSDDQPEGFPFRLDDETCRIGLIHLAEMRRILDGIPSAA
ncbi:MAG: hypothetical protein ACKOJC_05675 [Actinomycetota bacterium]